MRSATRGRDAAAMIERGADEIVARFRGTERGMGREGDVFQRQVRLSATNNLCAKPQLPPWSIFAYGYAVVGLPLSS
jgi:hypothetical protein